MHGRREFFERGVAGVFGASAVGWAARASGAAAGTKVVVGAIGCGGQGTNLIKRFASLDGVTVAYVCDPDRAHAESAAAAVDKIGGTAPKVVADLRTVLDDHAVDAVIVATPDHWHAPAAILACNAGKHVYVEKPCAHNLREGRLLVETARRTRRVVQHGTQSRTDPLIRHGIQLLRDGLIGEVLVAKAFNVQKRTSIGRASPTAPPAGFDYDLWLGPAPFVPFQPNRHHYSWHWWYDFGTGDMGNDGVHEVDIARWGLGVDTLPATVAALGGKYFFDDDQQFPDTQNVLFEYVDPAKPGRPRQLVFEMRIWSPYQPEGVENGNIFYGTEGWMLLSKRGVLQVFDAKGKPRPVPGKPTPNAGHQADFIEAIRAERAPAAEIGIGFQSAALCHLGNLATRVGRTLRLDPAKEAIIGDDEASRLLGRTYRENHWATPRGTA